MVDDGILEVYTVIEAFTTAKHKFATENILDKVFDEGVDIINSDNYKLFNMDFKKQCLIIWFLLYNHIQFFGEYSVQKILNGFAAFFVRLRIY